MEWTVLKTLFGALLALFAVVDASYESKSYEDESTSVEHFTSKQKLICHTARHCCEGWCFVYSASIEANANMELIGFSNASKIVFKSPKITELSSTLMNAMIAVEHLQLDGGIVPSIYVTPTLSSLWAQNNTVQEVLIDDEDNHQLGFLEVTFNKLKAVPANIHRLKKLIHLHLNDNEIEEISLDILTDLKHLEHLKLYKNRIIRVDTTVTLQLPTLFEISLSGNQLDELNISLWDFPTLKKIYLGQNKLRSVEGLAKKFSTLNETSLHENQWSCDWLQPVVREFRANNVTFQREEQCPSNGKEGGICCELSEFDEIGSNVRQMIDELRVLSNNRMRNDEKIEQVGEKIVNLNKHVKQFTQTLEQNSASSLGDNFQ